MTQPTAARTAKAHGTGGLDPKHLLDLTSLAFYRKHFGRLLALCMLLGAAVVCLSMALVWAKNQKVDRQYFLAEQGTGRLVRIIPMSEPHMQGGSLLTWLQNCVTQANTYDFVNYQGQFMRNKECFTPDGWQQFQSAVERAGTLQTVRNQRLVATAAADGAPVITKEGLLNGAYTWLIEIPVTVTYVGGQSGRANVTQHLKVQTLVSNVPTYVSKEGVGIAQYVATER